MTTTYDTAAPATPSTIDLPELARQTTAGLRSGAPSRVLFRTDANLVRGTNTQVQIRSGNHEFVIDEPAALGGEDTGANPVEHLLAALASCQIISVQVWAAKLGLVVEDVTVEAEGTIDLRGFFGTDPQVRAGFQGIYVKLGVSGPESPESYAELIRLVEAHCPVLDNLLNGLPVTVATRN